MKNIALFFAAILSCTAMENKDGSAPSWRQVSLSEYSVIQASTEDSLKKRLFASVSQIAYKDTNNALSIVNMTPDHVTSGGHDVWRIVNNAWHYALGKPAGKNTDGWLGFGGRQGKHWFTYRLADFGYVHWSTRQFQDITTVAPNYDRSNLSASVGSKTVFDQVVNVGLSSQWRNIWATPGGGEIYSKIHATAGQLKHDVVLNQAGRNWIRNNVPPETPAGETYFTFVFAVDFSGIPKVYLGEVLQDVINDIDDNESGGVAFRDAQDRLLSFMPADIAYVEGQRFVENAVQPIRKKFYKQGNNYYLLLGVRVDRLLSMPDGDLVFDPSQSLNIAANNDDACMVYLGSWNYFSTDIATGSYGSNYLWLTTRFALSTAIPGGSTINSATLTLTSTGEKYFITGDYLRLYVTNSSNAAQAASTTDRPAISGGNTTTYPSVAGDGVRWPASGDISWPANNVTVTSASFASLIQYLVNTYSGLSAGNYVNVWTTKGSTSGDRYGVCYWYENSSAKAADLYIEWTEGGGEPQKHPGKLPQIM